MKVTHVPPKPKMIIFEQFKTNDNETAAEILARFDAGLWNIILGESVLSTIRFSPRYFWPIYFVKFEQRFETLKSLSDAVRDLGFDFANATSLVSLNLEDPTLSLKFPNRTLWQDEDLGVYMISFHELHSTKKAIAHAVSDSFANPLESEWVACQSRMRPFFSNLIN
jgi:hypothetical protein